jgi:universal stress protein A
MSSILVAVDLEETSLMTVEFAVRMGSTNRAKLDLVHVLVSAIPARAKVHAPAELRDRMRAGEEVAARESLEALMKQHVPEESRGNCFLKRGEPAKAVCDLAGSGYEMVVVSTHGRTGLEHVVLGSVAERIVRFATIPVLVVR